ncbi:MAG: hypothetical protein SGCHY_002545, partial [Lobulomycetales sp.]
MRFTVDDERKVVHIELGWTEGFLACTSSFDIEFAGIKSIVGCPEEANDMIKGFRIGMELPGVWTWAR